jgi:hypothetical protein
MKRNFILFMCCLSFTFQSCTTEYREQGFKNISGIYPHLAYYNDEGECGTGAIVPWAERLWVVTYGPHSPFGSTGKFYEITPDLERIDREESIGGTPANRMIHKESSQLFIGPYVIDTNRNVRVIPYSAIPGRLTGTVRHLSDPANKVYFATMEEGFYEVDVHSLEERTLFVDANVKRMEDSVSHPTLQNNLLPGAHGKAAYSGQGVLVYVNNGELIENVSALVMESGALAEWNGEDWKLVRRNQFVEVTGPGGIYGNPDPENDPLWATGWDDKSIILGVREEGNWSFYRLPKASHSYDGAHGWNTEWPRIRNVGTGEDPDFLMTMHGMFWQFPPAFSKSNNSGIRARSAYLKVIGDFTRWMDRLVFGCDDSAQREFLNKRKAKGGIGGPGQSNSNLWFTSVDKPDSLGPVTAEGAVWFKDNVAAGEVSEPFLFAGWPHRCVWLMNVGKAGTELVFETDISGNGTWTSFRELALPPGKGSYIEFGEDQPGEWIRMRSGSRTMITAQFNYADEDSRGTIPSRIFDGLADAGNENASGGLLYGLGSNRRSLGVVSYNSEGLTKTVNGYYELNDKLELIKKNDPGTEKFITETFAIPADVVKVENSSVLVIDDRGRRWRLPKGDDAYDELTNTASLRICREMATERDLFNCHGTFYELPAENADGYARIRPIASHNFRVADYASYRGMLIMTGIDPDYIGDNEHIIRSGDEMAAVWAGVIDDLWQLGKPRGRGGPWKDSNVKAGIPSDPYLIGFYDEKKLTLSHTSDEPVKFNIEVDPSGAGQWFKYKEVEVTGDSPFTYSFPAHFQARWIRFTANKDCVGTAWLVYE